MNINFLCVFQKQVSIREETRVKYDHYLRKITILRQEHEEVSAKGSIESQKDRDRRERA